MKRTVAQKNDSVICQWIVMILVGLVFMFKPMFSLAVTPPAYTIITNQAIVTYYNDALDLYERVDSNIVKVEVGAVPSLTLTSDQIIDASLGQEVIFSQELANTGNVALIAKIILLPDSSSHFNLNNLHFYIDMNHNGKPDAGDIPITLGSDLPALAIGTSYQILTIGDVPNNVNMGNKSLFKLEVQASGSRNETATGQVSNQVNVVDVGAIRIFESANVARATPNSKIRYTVTALQSSGGNTQPAYLDIDGVNSAKVFIRSPIPKETRFQKVVSASGAQILYHIKGALTDNYYTTTLPSDLNQVDAIAFAWDVFPNSVTHQLSFDVQTNFSIANDIINQSSAYQTIAGQQTLSKSNKVILSPAQKGVLNFYNDDSYFYPVTEGSPEDPLYLGANAEACNIDSTKVESYFVTLSSAFAQDEETGILLVETGENTGFFKATIATNLLTSSDVIFNNDILTTNTDDTVTAVLNCHGKTYSTNISVNDSFLRSPFYIVSGRVFDSRNTGMGVANALVEIYETTDNPAIILEPSTIPAALSAASGANLTATPMTANLALVGKTITDSKGFYNLPRIRGVLNSSKIPYVIKVTSANYSYPSIFSPSIYPAFRVNAFASYDVAFSFRVGGSYDIDIPLDRVASPGEGLVIEKSVDKDVVEYGQVLTYTIKYKNILDKMAFLNVKLQDDLPRGFAYVSGSTRLNGKNVMDPNGAPGPNLIFSLGQIYGGKSGEITYQVQVRNSAPVGKATNIAQLTAKEGVSNTASATVNVKKNDVFSDDAFVLGTIFADCNGNKQKDPDEPGVPFVRLYLEDGTFVISDAQGKFSLYGLTPRTHVMKVDQSTLPVGAKLSVLNNRFAHDANSAFVDLKKGELHRTDFAIENCSVTIMDEIKSRQTGWNSDSVNEKLTSIKSSSLSSLDPYNAGDIKAKPSQGLLDGKGKVFAEKELLPLAGTQTMESYLPNQKESVNQTLPLPKAEELIKTLSNQLDFIDLTDNQIVPLNQQTVRVKGPLAGEINLYVNDQLISSDRIGKKVRLESQDIQINEYIGVNLQGGRNQLKLIMIDAQGKQQVKTIDITVPGKLARIEIQPVRVGVADGITPLPVVVRLLDQQGLTITGRSLVTLETTKGQWQIDNSKPNPLGGIDVFVDHGETTFTLINAEAGEVSIRVTSNLIKQTQDVSFSPNLRPLIAVGVVEGAVGLRDLKDKNIESVHNGDNFEQSIRTTFGDEGDKGAVGLRGALFLKGKVKGDYLLTLAYDSDKKVKDQMFRDIDPNKFYPIYGDDSIKGFDAQSTSELYVRVDKGNSFMLYGDFSTQENSFVDTMTVKGQSLGQYQRNLTGLKGQYVNSYVKTTYFAAYSDTKQKIITFDGRGISGPYDVNMGTFIKNSEVVEVITRSQSQPSLIIDRVQLSRFTDYSFDAFYNTILFTRPIPSIDINGNPVQIQISYEVESGGERYWVYGGTGDVWISDNISIGATLAEDKDPSTQYRLYSAHTVFDVSPTIGIALEMAQSQGIDQTLSTAQTNGNDLIKGKGYRAEIIANTQDSNFKSRTYYIKTDKLFRNDAAGVGAGREDIGVTVQYRLGDELVLNSEALQSKDSLINSRRSGLLIAAEQALSDNFSGRLGSRYIKEKTDNSQTINDDLTSIFARLSWKPKALPDLLAFVEAEQAVDNGNQHMFAVGSEYALSKQLSLYGRHEFISELGLGSTSSVSGSFGMAGNGLNTNRNATTLGMKYNYAASSSVFSEYRMTNAIDGRQAEAALGLNNGWELRDGLTMTSTFERIQPFSQGDDGLATAATLGLDYTASQYWKGTTRIEWRQSKNLQTWLHTLGVARKLNKDWSILASNIYGLEQRRDNSGDRTRDDARMGLAFRDSQYNKLNALFRYQMLLDSDKQNNDDSLHHVLSSHANYLLHPKLMVNGRYAISRNHFKVDHIKTNNTSHLVMGRLTYDVTDKIDIGLMASRFFGHQAYQDSYGTEIGYLMGKNIWFSVGYNFVGFKDKVLSGSDYTQQGGYIRLRIKFDEDMFQWLTD